jgi:hypothetical protein
MSEIGADFDAIPGIDFSGMLGDDPAAPDAARRRLA